MPQGVCLQVKGITQLMIGIPCLEMGNHRQVP